MEDDLDTRELIIGLRGGVPERCDFCDEKTHPDLLDPEEGGLWVCLGCQVRWKEEESR